MLRTSREWFVVLAVAVAATVFFSAAAAVANSLAGDDPSLSAPRLALTAVVALAVSCLLLLSERRRPAASLGVAALDGIQLAAIVIVTGSLFGWADSGRLIAWRSVVLLVGLPMLGILTHVLARRTPPASGN